MESDDQNVIKNEPIEINEERYFQVDFIKAIMIFLVIFDHTIPWTVKGVMGVALWERISIPVFLIIMGFNMGLSFKRKGETSLKKLYSANYFKGKFWRFLYPYLILYVLTTLFGLIVYEFNFSAIIIYHLFPHFMELNLFMGLLPFWGPGNWFIPVIFGSILIMPLLYKGFSSKGYWAIITLILLFVVEFLTQLFVHYTFFALGFSSGVDYYNTMELAWFFFCSILFYLSAVGLGMWFSNGHKIKSKHNLFMWILFPISLFYIILSQFFGLDIPFIHGDYNLFVFPYSAFVFLIGLALLPQEATNKIAKAISWIGKSTYHILLVQIFYFGITVWLYGDHYRASIFGINNSDDLLIFGYLLINWAICIPAGVFWYYIENKLRKYHLNKKKRKQR